MQVKTDQNLQQERNCNVEDEKTTREGINEFLTVKGYEVVGDPAK